MVPLISLESHREGPTVLVTANVHGDECTGLVATHQLDAALQTGLVRGRVVLVPSLNPMGLARVRRAVPKDGVDLNRCFPGSPRGSGASRYAWELWSALRSYDPELLVDLHADSVRSIPYAIVDRAVGLTGAPRVEMDAALRALGDATGLTVLDEYPDADYLRFGLDRSLPGAMVNHGSTLALTIEAGPRRALDPEAVDVAVGAVLRVLRHLELVERAPLAPASSPGGPFRRASAPRVRNAGIFVPARAPGDAFCKGDLLGTVRSVDGRPLEEVRARADGIVVSWAENAWIEARGGTGTLGLVES